LQARASNSAAGFSASLQFNVGRALWTFNGLLHRGATPDMMDLVFLHFTRSVLLFDKLGITRMGLFGSASGKQVDEFARMLVDEVYRLRAPEGKAGPGNPGLSLRNLEQKVDALFEKAADFRIQHKLGIYKKARLANTFRWEMKDRGYDSNFIEMITEKLVVAVSKKD
jgi:hypothetical protein